MNDSSLQVKSGDFVPMVGPAGGVPLAIPRPRMSVIVPVHNKASELSLCLKALTEYADKDCELIVVDDQSTDNVRDVAVEHGAHYFCTPWRGGPALARNVGAKHALGDILLFVDADVVVRPDTLAVVQSCFGEDSKVAALFGSYDDEPACRDFCSSFKNLMHHYVHQTSNSYSVTFWAGCGAVRREVFEALGGFNTQEYPTSSVEDIDLGMRLSQNKQKVLLLKHLQVKHLKKWNARKLWQTDIFRRAIPWSLLILKTHTMPNDLNVTWASRASACLVATLAVLIGGLVAHLVELPIKRPMLVESLAVLSMSLLIFLNRGLYDLFRRKRGLRFAVGAILMHWLYLLYSGMTFSVCCLAKPFRSSLQSASSGVEFKYAHRHLSNPDPLAESLRYAVKSIPDAK